MAIGFSGGGARYIVCGSNLDYLRRYGTDREETPDPDSSCHIVVSVSRIFMKHGQRSIPLSATGIQISPACAHSTATVRLLPGI